MTQLTPEQQQALDAYIAAVAPFYDIIQQPWPDTLDGMHQRYAAIDQVDTNAAPLWARCLDLGIPVSVLDRATEQRFGVTVDRSQL